MFFQLSNPKETFPFHFTGPGIHSGERCRIHVRPGEPSQRCRVVFCSGNNRIPASVDALSPDGYRATRLQNDRIQINTVEHLLFALFCYFDTARVVLDGPEIPILDGSAARFTNAFASHSARRPPRFFRISRPMVIEQEGAIARIVPCDLNESPRYEVQLAYPAPIGAMCCEVFPDRTNLEKEIAPARTFALESDVDQLRARGLARGGSLENALVFGKDGPLNQEGMRFENEPARHKMLDLIGDLSLLGSLPFAHMHITRPGHALNHRIVHALVADARKSF